MAFRRATGRDEMLKRNMEKLAARRRASVSKPTATKQDLKVNAKPTVNYMGSVGAYGKDAPEYGKMLEGVAPPSQVKPPTAPPPVRPDPPAETPPAQPETPPAQPDPPQAPAGKLADLRGGGGDPKETSYRYVPKNTDLSAESTPLSTTELRSLKNSLKGLFTSIQKQTAGKVYAGKNYGFVSQARYKKLKAAGKI